MNENKKFYITVTACWLLALAAVAFLFCRIWGLQNNSSGTATVTERIEAAKDINNQSREQQQVAKQSINRAEERAETIQRSLDESRSLFEQSRESIERCEQVLRAVEERGAAQKASN